jgi:tyrosine phenol-lyase
MIQKRDPRYAQTRRKDILREMMLYGDGCTVSGKKDFLINIGGVLAFKRQRRAGRARRGDAARLRGQRDRRRAAAADLAAMAQGVARCSTTATCATRVSRRRRLGQRLMEGGVPIVMPPGSHAIFIDARRFPAACRPGRLPGAAARRGDLRRDRRAGDGARQRLEGPRREDRRRTIDRRSSSCG